MERHKNEAIVLPQVDPPAELSQKVMAAIFAEPSTSWELALQKRTRSNTIALVPWLVISGVLVYLTLIHLLPTASSYFIDQLLHGLTIIRQTVVPWLSSLISIWRSFAWTLTFIVSVAGTVSRATAPLFTLWRLATTGPLLDLTVVLGMITLIGQAALVRILSQHTRS